MVALRGAHFLPEKCVHAELLVPRTPSLSSCRCTERGFEEPSGTTFRPDILATVRKSVVRTVICKIFWSFCRAHVAKGSYPALELPCNGTHQWAGSAQNQSGLAVASYGDGNTRKGGVEARTSERKWIGERWFCVVLKGFVSGAPTSCFGAAKSAGGAYSLGGGGNKPDIPRSARSRTSRGSIGSIARIFRMSKMYFSQDSGLTLRSGPELFKDSRSEVPQRPEFSTKIKRRRIGLGRW